MICTLTFEMILTPRRADESESESCLRQMSYQVDECIARMSFQSKRVSDMTNDEKFAIACEAGVPPLRVVLDNNLAKFYLQPCIMLDHDNGYISIGWLNESEEMCGKRFSWMDWIADQWENEYRKCCEEIRQLRHG